MSLQLCKFLHSTWFHHKQTIWKLGATETDPEPFPNATWYTASHPCHWLLEDVHHKTTKKKIINSQILRVIKKQFSQQKVQPSCYTPLFFLKLWSVCFLACQSWGKPKVDSRKQISWDSRKLGAEGNHCIYKGFSPMLIARWKENHRVLVQWTQLPIPTES